MPPAFFIVGPTAVGKTGLAVELAARCRAEIVSADAFQVYEGFDLLTAKPTIEQQRRVSHHLVGSVPTSTSYNVARYLDDARQTMARIAQEHRPVIVVGGSGLYVKALTHGLAPLPAADASVRAELEKASNADLLACLAALDPVTAAVIDARNRRRLVRALEVCHVTGQPFSSFRREWNPPSAAASSKGIFLFRERPDQLARISARLDWMFAQGVVDEVRTTPFPSGGAEQILGLRQIQAHLTGQTTPAECREQIGTATRQYAKRQVTWFKREICFEPVNASTHSSDTDLLESIQDRYRIWHSLQETTSLLPRDHKQAGRT